jgi:hypothetical protein
LATTLNSALQSLPMSPAAKQHMQAAASSPAASQASMAVAYGESDRIILSSTALPGFGSGTLMSMTGPLSMFNLFDQNGNKGTKP